MAVVQWRELVVVQLSFHQYNFHSDEHQLVLGPRTTWFRQPDNGLNYRLAAAVKSKFLRSNPEIKDEDVTITRIEVKGSPLFDNELFVAPLGLLQMNDNVDVYLHVKQQKDSQSLNDAVSQTLEESDTQTGKEQDTQMAAETDTEDFFEQSQALL